MFPRPTCRPYRWLALWALCAAASSCSGGQSGTITIGHGSYGPDCEVAESEPIDLDVPLPWTPTPAALVQSPNGQVGQPVPMPQAEATPAPAEPAPTPRQMFERWTFTPDTPLSYSDYSSATQQPSKVTTVNLTLQYDGGHAWIDREHSPSGQYPCDEYLRVEATLSFQSADGAFSEVIPVTVRHAQHAQAVIQGTQPRSQFAGSFDFTQLEGVFLNPVLQYSLRLTTPVQGQVWYYGDEADDDPATTTGIYSIAHLQPEADEAVATPAPSSSGTQPAESQSP